MQIKQEVARSELRQDWATLILFSHYIVALKLNVQNHAITIFRVFIIKQHTGQNMTYEIRVFTLGPLVKPWVNLILYTQNRYWIGSQKRKKEIKFWIKKNTNKRVLAVPVKYWYVKNPGQLPKSNTHDRKFTNFLIQWLSFCIFHFVDFKDLQL